jgi:hypothetical protein
VRRKTPPGWGRRFDMLTNNEWEDALDQVGAAATRQELWSLLGQAPQVWPEAALRLFAYLIDAPARVAGGDPS